MKHEPTGSRVLADGTPAGFRLFHIAAMAFVVSLVVSNILAVKLALVGPFVIPAGIICFPISYILGDALTEVWGFRRTRSIIYGGFFLQAIAALAFAAGDALPPAPSWLDQPAFSRLFGQVPRIVLASLFAYLAGELLNSYVLSSLKRRMDGRHFWFRALGSTVVGQGADSVIFNIVAFWGVFPNSVIWSIVISGWFLKSMYELVVLPLTYVVVRYLKRVEGVDHIDSPKDYVLVG